MTCAQPDGLTERWWLFYFENGRQPTEEEWSALQAEFYGFTAWADDKDGMISFAYTPVFSTSDPCPVGCVLEPLVFLFPDAATLSWAGNVQWDVPGDYKFTVTANQIPSYGCCGNSTIFLNVPETVSRDVVVHVVADPSCDCTPFYRIPSGDSVYLPPNVSGVQYAIKLTWPQQAELEIETTSAERRSRWQLIPDVAIGPCGQPAAAQFQQAQIGFGFGMELEIDLWWFSIPVQFRTTEVVSLPMQMCQGTPDKDVVLQCAQMITEYYSDSALRRVRVFEDDQWIEETMAGPYVLTDKTDVFAYRCCIRDHGGPDCPLD